MPLTAKVSWHMLLVNQNTLWSVRWHTTFCGKPENRSLIPRTHVRWKKRPNFTKLSSELHMCTMVHKPTQMHYNKNKQKLMACMFSFSLRFMPFLYQFSHPLDSNFKPGATPGPGVNKVITLLPCLRTRTLVLVL